MPADTLSLSGKTAVITGSGKENGIGAAIARALARNGANVALHYVSPASKSRAESVASEISNRFGTSTTIAQGSLDNYETAEKIVQHTLKAFGVDKIDILVNNASTAQNVPLMKTKQDQLQNEFAVNVFGVIYLTQAVVKIGNMPQGGRIINIGSIASKVLVPEAPVYAATKAAQDALTTLLAGELGKSRGITVNTLAPGPVPTDMSKEYLVNPDGSPTDLQKAMLGGVRAADRVGTPEDLADATLLLVQERSRWITAQFISLSGGVTGTM